IEQRRQRLGSRWKQSWIDEAGARHQFPQREDGQDDGDPPDPDADALDHGHGLVGTGLNSVEMTSCAGTMSFSPPSFARSSDSCTAGSTFDAAMSPSVSSFMIEFSYSSAAISGGIS